LKSPGPGGSRRLDLPTECIPPARTPGLGAGEGHDSAAAAIGKDRCSCSKCKVFGMELI